MITITGELTTSAYVDIKKIVNRIAGNVGATINIDRQSPEIAEGVDSGGAGDQGIMVGYACNETESFMPLEYELARDLCRFIYARHQEDGKTQVTIDTEDPKTIIALVASFRGIKSGSLEELVIEWAKEQKKNVVNAYLNPAGDWNIGGFDADTGLTGRKIVVDSYGPRVPIGGGSYSGKDATKMDRSGAYMARKIAVDILKAKKAKEVMISIAYAIGKKEPIAVEKMIVGGGLS